MRGTEFVRFSARGVAFDTVVSAEGESFMRYFQTNDFLLTQMGMRLEEVRDGLAHIVAMTFTQSLIRRVVGAKVHPTFGVMTL